MSYRNESALVAAMVAAIKRDYPQAWVLKTTSEGQQRKGVPDLLISLHGRLIAIEVKHQKPSESLFGMLERVETLQRLELGALEHSGAFAFVCWEVEQVLQILRLVDYRVERTAPDDLVRAVAFVKRALNPDLFVFSGSVE